ncbi:MAG TPA: hypothetical protein VKU39_13480 [Streptosporangiaceae bacterium]|nr:hypothetical protein [Streptosporangiaceae bacterium]
MSQQPSAGQATPGVKGFFREYRDAIETRAILIVAGVVLLGMGFVLSYVAAFHHQSPHRIPVQVTGPAADRAAAGLNAVEGNPVQATVAATPAQARSAVAGGSTSGALVIDPSSTTDTVYVASGGGASLATAVQDVFQTAEASQHRNTRVMDLVPLQPGDGRGLTGFYFVIGLLITGYLAAAALGVTRGARQPTVRRTVFRLSAFIVPSVVSGLLAALIVDPLLGALTGHFVALWGLGALLVACAGTVTVFFQALLDTLGIGLTVILFVILGNPSAGGAYQWPLLPTFFRVIGPALPNGAGVAALRRIVYFGGQDITGNLLIICAYLVGGSILALVAARLVGSGRRRC